MYKRRVPPWNQHHQDLFQFVSTALSNDPFTILFPGLVELLRSLQQVAERDIAVNTFKFYFLEKCDWVKPKIT